MIFHRLALGAVALQLTLVHAASEENYDPVKDFCRRFSHQSAVVGDRLYIDGGQINIDGQKGRNYTNTRFLYHDLSSRELKGKDLGMPPLMTNLSKPDKVPSLQGGILWADQANARLFQFGGEWMAGAEPDTFKGWKYDVYADKWESFNAEDSINRLSWGAGTSVEPEGKGYYLGGWMDERNIFSWSGPKKASNRLLEYDMVEDTWTNRTETPMGDGRAEGALFWVPSGDRGMLIHFGGVSSPDGSEALATSVDMNTIDIIDMANGKWYQHNATGTTPERRRRFCGGVISAKDKSSHQIYIYGGMGFGNQTDGFDDVYILSIPTFTWIKVYPSKPRKDSEAFPHYDLSCNVVHDSQMLIIGGVFPRNLEGEIACDAPEVAGVHNLWLGKNPTTKEFWGEYMPNATGYDVPSDVLDVVGGTKAGSADRTQPSGGFDNHDLGILFGRTYDAPKRSPTRSPPSSSQSSDKDETEDEGGSSTKRLLTIVLPSVLGGALVIGTLVVFFCLRRRKTPPAPASASAPAPDLQVITNQAEPKSQVPTEPGSPMVPYPPPPAMPHPHGFHPYPPYYPTPNHYASTYAGSTTAPTEYAYDGTQRVDSPPVPPAELGAGTTPAPLPAHSPPPLPPPGWGDHKSSSQVMDYTQQERRVSEISDVHMHSQGMQMTYNTSWQSTPPPGSPPPPVMKETQQ